MRISDWSSDVCSSDLYERIADAPARLLDRAGEVYLGYDGSYRSNFSSNASASAYTWIDGYALSNFRAGFRTEDGLDIFAWVRHAFDTKDRKSTRLNSSH